MTIKLIRYDAACRAIAACVRVDEAKKIRDYAVAYAAYAKQAENEQMQADAIEIQMRATRRIDELRQEQARTIGLNKGSRFAAGPQRTHRDERPTLAEAGVKKRLAHQARTLGRLSPAQFEKAVIDARRSVRNVVRGAVRLSEIDHAKANRDRRGGGNFQDLKAIIRTGLKFKVIYADPPWDYKTYSGKGKQRSADRHYGTMDLDEIKALPVWELADQNCALFMWVTWPHLQHGLEIIKVWGFKYATAAFVWVKQNKRGKGIFSGMGHYTMANTEPCIVATKGSPLRLHKDVKQVITSPRRGHSEKPDEARGRIERLYDGPYLELFGRKPVDGWTVWGDEVPFVAQLEAAE